MGPGLVLRSSWGAFVCGQLASVVSLAYVTRRRPLAPPMYLYSVLLCGGGGPQGGRALWALTFYNPNSVYRYESDDTWRHLNVSPVERFYIAHVSVSVHL